MGKTKVWVNGQILESQYAKIDSAIGAFHYGCVAYEGIIALNNYSTVYIFRPYDHIKRLFFSAGILGLDMRYSQKEILKAILDLIRLSGLGSYYIRPIVFCEDRFGKFPYMSRKASCIIHLKRFTKTLYLLNMRRSVTVKISDIIQPSWGQGMAQAKISGKDLFYITQKKRAKTNGFDDALLIDKEGYINEATTADICLIKDNTIYTPICTNALKGVTQDTVVVIAENLGYEAKEIGITVDDLYKADELFLTNTGNGILNVSTVYSNKIGLSAFRYKLTQTIRKKYVDILYGKDKNYMHWLTPLEMRSDNSSY